MTKQELRFLHFFTHNRLVSCVAFLLILQSCKNEDVPQKAKFADPKTCYNCHEREYAEWLGSDHDLAMQVATDSTVLGDFDDASLTHFGVTSRFFKRNGKFLVNTEGPDGKLSDFEVKYTFGVRPLQQYLIEFPGGRAQCLTIAWDTVEKRWFHLYPNERISPHDPLHWTGIYQNWNMMCADCHSTDLKKNYDAVADSYETTWDAIDVSCQACHGPGSEHVAWAEAHKNGEALQHKDKGLHVNLENNSRQQVEACAPCHSRRQQITDQDWYGEAYLNHFLPSLLREDLYYPDGQMLDEVYVYGSFIQSKMFHSGVLCSDCHNPHSLKLVKQGNDLCTQCHRQQPNERFATLRLQNYDSPDHHFHKPGCEGAQCIECHMPSRTYMVVDPRRDHSFKIPRPDLTEKIGTPNACNRCHDNKPPAWAAAAIKKWYGHKTKGFTNFAEALDSSRAGHSDGAARLLAVVDDKTEPGIARASALELLRSYGGPAAANAIIAATKDDDPLVRMAAASGLNILAIKERLPNAARLLDDPIRAVRIEAARATSTIPTGVLGPSQKGKFDKALTEFLQMCRLNADQPGTHFNLGVLYDNLGKPDSAEIAYKTAIDKDPYLLPASVNLGNLYNRQGRNEEAEQVFRQAIEHAPDEGRLYYSLGLLLAEMQKLKDAAKALRKAAQLLPEYARIQYNYGLALQHLGLRDQAEEQLQRAYRLDTNNPELAKALAIFYVQNEDWQQAYPYVQKLTQLLPRDPSARNLLGQVERKLKQ